MSGIARVAPLLLSLVLPGSAVVAGGAVAGCKVVDPLFCNEDKPCEDLERPYCDLTGEFPASEGRARTCIPYPFDAGVFPDAGTTDAAGQDANGETFAVEVVLGGAGVGQVISTPSGIDCGQTCSASFADGTSVTLTASADAVSRFAGWGGACSGDGACVLEVTASRVVSASFALRPNYAFVTAGTYHADFGGIAAADALCANAADDAGLPGTYVAWLASSTQGVNALQRISAARGWVRVDGKPFADTAAALADGEIYYPLIIDNLGNVHDGGVSTGPWTGANERGEPAGDDCAGWTAKNDGRPRVGNPEAGTRRWTNSSGVFAGGRCNVEQRPLYCFGIDRQVEVAAPEPPSPGRLAFVSSSVFVAEGGVAAAHALCAAEASAAGLPGTFKALLATTGASAASRFNAAGPPWVRPDGVLLANTATTFLSSERWEAAISVTATGDYVDVATWGGARSLSMAAEALDDTCNDWTGSSRGLQGRSSSSHVQSAMGIASAGGTACAGGGAPRIYCLQDE